MRGEFSSGQSYDSPDDITYQNGTLTPPLAMIFWYVLNITFCLVSVKLGLGYLLFCYSNPDIICVCELLLFWQLSKDLLLERRLQFTAQSFCPDSTSFTFIEIF